MKDARRAERSRRRHGPSITEESYGGRSCSLVVISPSRSCWRHRSLRPAARHDLELPGLVVERPAIRSRPEHRSTKRRPVRLLVHLRRDRRRHVADDPPREDTGPPPSRGRRKHMITRRSIPACAGMTTLLRRWSLRAEDAVTCIAQPWQDVAMVVQLAVDRRRVDRNVGMCVGERLHPFRRCD